MSRNKLYRILTIALIAAGAVLVVLARRERGGPSNDRRSAQGPAPQQGLDHSRIARAFQNQADGAQGAAPALQQVGGNLFAEPGSWLDQNGKTWRLTDFRGHAAVFTFIYTTCDDACPLIVRSMQKGLAAVPEELRAGARFILFSFDPETDKPEQLGRYAKDFGLQGSQWVLLTATDEQVRRIADKVSFRYRRIGKHFSHNAVIAVAASDGEIVGWFADERITQTDELSRGLAKALSL